MRYLKTFTAVCLVSSAVGLTAAGQDQSRPDARTEPQPALETTQVPINAGPAAREGEVPAAPPATAAVEAEKANRALGLTAPVAASAAEPARKSPRRKSSPHDEQLLIWADIAFNRSVKALKSGKADDAEPAYRWSRRMMKAEEAHVGNPSEAARNHFRRMTDLEVMVKAAKEEPKDIDEYNYRISAVEYYRTEAEKLLENATARAYRDDTVPAQSTRLPAQTYPNANPFEVHQARQRSGAPELPPELRRPSTAKKAESPHQTKVYVLAHAPAQEVSMMIRELLDVKSTELRMAVDARTNRVFVNGAAGKIAEVDKLIQQLDVPGKQPATIPDRSDGAESPLRTPAGRYGGSR